MTKEIGGYFGIENNSNITEYLFDEYLHLNTGRNCLEYILLNKHYNKVYLPYYTCDVVLHPISKHKISYEFYDVDNNLEPILNLNDTRSDSVIIVNNYFGIKSKFIRELVLTHKNIIIDNSQALFSGKLGDVDAFYSPRKFIGISDGGLLLSNLNTDSKLSRDLSFERMSHLLKRTDMSAEYGYKDFIKNEKKLDNNDVKLMSNISESILKSIDFKIVKHKRILNFEKLHSELKNVNSINISKMYSTGDVPLVYPLRIKNAYDLKKDLIKSKVYCATYWPNVYDWCDSNINSYNLAKEIIPLPIDQRYDISDMELLISIIKKAIKDKL